MFGRNKGISFSKPKKVHSLEYLTYLYSILQKNKLVTNQNSDIIEESLRVISEIIIWGDQNDSAVMDFFIEENILAYFLKYLKQEHNGRIAVQLLQTLNILFENISNQKAIYYLLSNNHTNVIIKHRFDFSDEEVMAYYISFLKILSFRLNTDIIHFFFIERRNEFDLYVEAIKLFAHPESMVRIAVRTVTLNVHRVRDESALKFIHCQTSLGYFSHLVWSLGNTILDIDALHLTDQKSLARAKDLVAEHIDNLHYLNDLFSLNIDCLNEVLCDQLVRRLILPLQIRSLTNYDSSIHNQKAPTARGPRLSYSLALFTITHIYLTLHYPRLLNLITEIILIGDHNVNNWIQDTHFKLTSQSGSLQLPEADLDASGTTSTACTTSSITTSLTTSQSTSLYQPAVIGDTELDEPVQDPAIRIAQALVIATCSLRILDQPSSETRLNAYISYIQKHKCSIMFTQPSASLELYLIQAKGVTSELVNSLWPTYTDPSIMTHVMKSREAIKDQSFEIPPEMSEEQQLCSLIDETTDVIQGDISLNRPLLRALFDPLEINSNSKDLDALFSILLLISMIENEDNAGSEALDLIFLTGSNTSRSSPYNLYLVSKLVNIICNSCKAYQIRLITVQFAFYLLTYAVCDLNANSCLLTDEHFAELIGARERAMLALRGYFQNDLIFLDMFESQLRSIQSTVFLSVAPFTMNAYLFILSNMSWMELKKHKSNCCFPYADSDLFYLFCFPETEEDHVRRSIRIFLIIHVWLEQMFAKKRHNSIKLSTDLSNELVRTNLDDNPTTYTTPNTTTTTTPTTTNTTTTSSSGGRSKQNYIKQLFSNLTEIPGLGGLGNVLDSKQIPVPKIGDKLDLSLETLIGCTVERNSSFEKRFIVSYGSYLILVEPDSKQMGWGVITFIGSLQDLETFCDSGDSRCLHITIRSPATSISDQGSMHSCSVNIKSNSAKQPIWDARFLFEDHIRCMTARQLLIRGKSVAQQNKLRKIATLLDFSPQYIRSKFLVKDPQTSINQNEISSGGSSSSSLLTISNSQSQPYFKNSTKISSALSTENAAHRDLPNFHAGSFLADHRSHGNANRFNENQKSSTAILSNRVFTPAGHGVNQNNLFKPSLSNTQLLTSKNSFDRCVETSLTESNFNSTTLDREQTNVNPSEDYNIDPLNTCTNTSVDKLIKKQ